MEDLAALAALGQPRPDDEQWRPPHRGPAKAAWLRFRKAKLAADRLRRQQLDMAESHRDDMAAVCAIAAVHAPRVRQPTLSILRAAFTPTSTWSYSHVLGAGHSWASDCRAVVCAAALELQEDFVNELLGRPGPLPWVVYVKMHDATQVEVTVSKEVMTALSGSATCSSGGTVTAQSFVQRDRVATPQGAEALLLPPVILPRETSEVVALATRSGRAGSTVRLLLEGLRTGKLSCFLYFDVSDSSSSNKRAFRLTQQWVDAMSGCDERFLSRFARCDLHMLHLSASISLARSASLGAMFSAALLLRVGNHRFRCGLRSLPVGAHLGRTIRKSDSHEGLWIGLVSCVPLISSVFGSPSPPAFRVRSHAGETCT